LTGKFREQEQHDFFTGFLEQGGRRTGHDDKVESDSVDTLKADPAPTLLFDLVNDREEMTDVAGDRSQRWWSRWKKFGLRKAHNAPPCLKG